MEKPKRNLKILTKRWLDKAEEDFRYASFGLAAKDNSFLAPICFHFQQAAEKYLKAFLVAHNHKPPRIHTLENLIKECSKYDAFIRSLTSEASFLTPFYIDTRYPVHWPMGFLRQDAEKAQEAAQRIGEFVKEKLKGKIR